MPDVTRFKWARYDGDAASVPFGQTAGARTGQVQTVKVVTV